MVGIRHLLGGNSAPNLFSEVGVSADHPIQPRVGFFPTSREMRKDENELLKRSTRHRH